MQRCKDYYSVAENRISSELNLNIRCRYFVLFCFVSLFAVTVYGDLEHTLNAC